MCVPNAKAQDFCKGGRLVEFNYVAVLIFYNGEKGVLK